MVGGRRLRWIVPWPGEDVVGKSGEVDGVWGIIFHFGQALTCLADLLDVHNGTPV